ncbi:FAD-binding protein [Thermodesulfobacteriota bacterium]
MTTKKNNKAISRRELIKGAVWGAGAVGLMAGLGSQKATAGEKLETKEMSSDAIVIGAGFAGLTAAIRILQQGSKVIVTEKQKWKPFSNTTRAYGATYCFNSALHRSKGIAKSSAAHYEDMRKYLPLGDPDLQKAWADNIGDAVDMLIDLGLKPKIMNMPHNRKGAVVPPKMFFDVVPPAIKAAGGIILDETRADKILVNDDGMVIGVMVQGKDGHMYRIKSQKAIIIGSGGFQLNPELVTRYMGPEADKMIPLLRYGLGGTGDGLIMSMDIGAGTSLGLNTFYGHLVFVNEKGERPKAFHHSSGGSLKFDVLGVVVNIFGKRFTDESGSSEVIAQEALNQPESVLPPYGKAFVVCDQKIYNSRKRDFTSASKAGAVIAKADTLKGLADKVKKWGVDGEAMVNTVKKFNAAVAQGNTNELVPPKSIMMEAGYVYSVPLITKIDTPPFYAIPSRPAMTFTEGGIKVNPTCEVLNRNGHPIPRLFAGGDCVGGFCNRNYVAGTGIGKAIVQGYISGTKAHSLSKMKI